MMTILLIKIFFAFLWMNLKLCTKKQGIVFSTNGRVLIHTLDVQINFLLSASSIDDSAPERFFIAIVSTWWKWFYWLKSSLYFYEQISNFARKSKELMDRDNSSRGQDFSVTEFDRISRLQQDRTFSRWYAIQLLDALSGADRGAIHRRSTSPAMQSRLHLRDIVTLRLPLRAGGDLSVFEHNSPHASRRKVCHVPVPPSRLRLCARQCGAGKNRSTMISPRRLRDTPPNSGRPWRMKPAVYIDLSFLFLLLDIISLSMCGRIPSRRDLRAKRNSTFRNDRESEIGNR